MGITNLLLTVIAILLTAIYVKTAPLDTGKALADYDVAGKVEFGEVGRKAEGGAVASINTSGRYQIAAAGDTAPKAFIVDTIEGKVWIVDTARIIKYFDLQRDF